jgi:hypothetical protein
MNCDFFEDEDKSLTAGSSSLSDPLPEKRTRGRPKKSNSPVEVKQERLTSMCKKCDQPFSVSSNSQKSFYKKHKRECKGRDSEDEKVEFECSSCDFKSIGAAGLKIHTGLRHSGKLHECNYCDEKFQSRSSRTKHEKAEHTEETGSGASPDKSTSSSLLCNCCGKIYKSAASLKIHRGEYRYDYSGICEVCGESVKNVKVHMTMKHRGPP